MRVHLRDQLGDGLRLVAFGLELGLEAQGDAALALVGPWRAVRHELGPAGAGHQRVVLHQRLRRLAEARRAAIGAVRKPGGLARDGARLGTRAEGSGNAMGHGAEYGGSESGMEDPVLSHNACPSGGVGTRANELN